MIKPKQMTDNSKKRWNQRYQSSFEVFPHPSTVLEENQHLLPASGKALDLACGLGGNALLLSKMGLETHAWDISPVALEQLNKLANRGKQIITTREIDLKSEHLPTASFDVIVVSHFLQRDLCDAISDALRVGGLLFYQTFSQAAVSDEGPKNPAYRLTPGELLDLFPELRPVSFKDEGCIGDTQQGYRNQSWLVAVRDKKSTELFTSQ